MTKQQLPPEAMAELHAAELTVYRLKQLFDTLSGQANGLRNYELAEALHNVSWQLMSTLLATRGARFTAQSGVEALPVKPELQVEPVGELRRSLARYEACGCAHPDCSACGPLLTPEVRP